MSARAITSRHACVAFVAAGILAHMTFGQGATPVTVERPTTAATAAGPSNTSPATSPATTSQATSPVLAPIGDPLADLRLVPIDPGTEDVSRLWEGGRQMPVELRKPLNFEQVYRVEGDLSRLGVLGVSPATGQAMYARASGGLVAIFPQSEYVATKQGRFPVVPANTTFLLGSIQTSPNSPAGVRTPEMGQMNRTAASMAQRVDQRAFSRRIPDSAPPPRRERISIWNSEATRRLRLATLLDEAKDAAAKDVAAKDAAVENAERFDLEAANAPRYETPPNNADAKAASIAPPPPTSLDAELDSAFDAALTPASDR
jgi:hypothetical protein